MKRALFRYWLARQLDFQAPFSGSLSQNLIILIFTIPTTAEGDGYVTLHFDRYSCEHYSNRTPSQSRFRGDLMCPKSDGSTKPGSTGKAYILALLWYFCRLPLIPTTILHCSILQRVGNTWAMQWLHTLGTYVVNAKTLLPVWEGGAAGSRLKLSFNVIVLQACTITLQPNHSLILS